jgi:CRP/FNR family cyclic AMP-dependent transcriptional regulator
MALQQSSILKALKAGSLFATLTDVEMEFLARRTRSRSVSAGELLFSEGDPCAGLFMIASGRVRIFKTSASGREHVLAIEGPGSSIAELPVFDGGNYPASAAGVEPTDLVFISREDFRAMCLENPEIALKVLQVVGARLRRLVGIIEELSYTTVRHRLISLLLRRARSENRMTDRGLTFTLGGSHQELASQIGTVRELVSRNIARLQAQGFIEVRGHDVTVLNLDGLEDDLNSTV